MRVFSIIFAILALSTASQAATPAVDLLKVYPEARAELISLASCRAFYVGQHFKEPVSAEEISRLSAEACKKELGAFLAKIRKPQGDPVFIGQLDQLVMQKIAKVRSFGGVMPGAGPAWSRCVTTHLDRTMMQSAPDMAWNNAYAACHDEESAAYDALKATGTSGDPTAIIGQMKKALRSSVDQNLRAQQGRPR